MGSLHSLVHGRTSGFQFSYTRKSMIQMATDEESVAFASFFGMVDKFYTLMLARLAFLLYTPYLS